jgi:hypothetical protein
MTDVHVNSLPQSTVVVPSKFFDPTGSEFLLRVLPSTGADHPGWNRTAMAVGIHSRFHIATLEHPDSHLGDVGIMFTSAKEAAESLVALLAIDRTYRHVASDVLIMLTLAEGGDAQHDLVEVPLTERARALMQRVEIERSVHRSVLEEGTYSATKVGGLLGSNSKNPRDKASRLRQKSELLGVDVDGSVRYPAFQFDASRAALRPGVAEANRAMNAREDSWAVASWWLTPHARLNEGARPADLALAGDAVRLAQLVASSRTD